MEASGRDLINKVTAYLNDPTPSPSTQINEHYKTIANSYFGQISTVQDELFDACMAENVEGIERALLEIGHPNITNKFGNGLLYCCIACKKNVSALLLLQHPKVNLNMTDDHGNNMLYWAAMADNLEIFNKLIDLNINVNHRNKRGMTLLHEIACLWRIDEFHYQIVGILLDNGANPYLKDNKGFTVLERAEQHSNIIPIPAKPIGDCLYKIV